ncbi:LysR family transcriptional regulator [Bacillus sp. Marseille-P3661]|uniref:LysR family transcriptional regulator n=1 Tax=Bacillus sp. Marseille-P3661 TaxID=1936234 RepID=UPI000C85442B|nr:LysR family transcriptional regulator [Bacillus sp. Marseille-P3661]
MELHQIEYVIALEKYMKFSIAADEIHISQPTLSHQIKKLEKELGVDLFVRNTRSVQLTPAGEEFLKHGKRILGEIDLLKNAMVEFTNLNKGHIKIGALPIITSLGITPILAAFQNAFPGINMEIREEDSDRLIKKMNSTEIEVAFIDSAIISKQDQDFDFYPLINDKLVVYLSSSHKLARKRYVEFSELSNERILTVSGLRNLVTHTCRNVGFEPNIIIESSQVQTIKGLVEENVGIAFFSSKIASSLLNEKTTYVDLSIPIMRVTGLAIAKNNNLLVTQSFKDFVLSNYYVQI